VAVGVAVVAAAAAETVGWVSGAPPLGDVVAPVGVASAPDADVVWLASEERGSDEELSDEDSSPMAARIASSHAWAASTVGEVWAAVEVAEAGVVPCAAAICAAVGCCRDETLVIPPIGLTDMRLPGSRAVPDS
jgi:hypothetical protein